MDDYNTLAAMDRLGGSFVRALAAAARLADPENLERIKTTWPDAWARYAEYAALDTRREPVIRLTSSHGTATFDRFGRLIEDDLAAGMDAMAEEDRPVQLDVFEWCRMYPEESPYGEHDILDWGYLTVAGKYEEPCHDWRRDRAARRQHDGART